jgi:hypothetical protein
MRKKLAKQTPDCTRTAKLASPESNGTDGSLQLLPSRKQTQCSSESPTTPTGDKVARTNKPPSEVKGTQILQNLKAKEGKTSGNNPPGSRTYLDIAELAGR